MVQDPASNGDEAAFLAETARLRAAAIAGQSGRLSDLFDFLSSRGSFSPPATQDEIARDVFGQQSSDADDATVRVYVHRLRKRLDDFYAANPPLQGAVQLEIPPGIYALRMVREAEDSAAVPPPPAARAGFDRTRWLAVAGVAALIAFFAGWLAAEQAPRANALWEPLIESDRPVLLVLGDYYIYGEIDPVNPEDGRLIRDFRVNSPEDLLLMQESEPERFEWSEDMGLNYLPFSAAYAMQEVVPIFAAAGKQVTVIPASQMTPEMLNRFNVVYLGLLSGMGLLEDLAFEGSGFAIGESYDEIELRESGESWISDEARRLASPVTYSDYGYISRTSVPGGAQLVVIAGQRDTALRGISPIVSGASLPGELGRLAGRDAPVEALFEVTGQQGADLSEHLLLARSRE